MAISFSPSRRRLVSVAAQTLFSSSLFGLMLSGAFAQTPAVPTVSSAAATAAMAETVYNGPRYVPGEVLVGVAPTSSLLTARNASALVSAAAASRKQVEAIASAVTISQVPQLGLLRLRVNSGETVEQAVARLKASGQVSFAEPNYVRHAFSTPNDPGYPAVQWGPQKIQADLAWDIYQPQAPTVIAIIDTGVTLNHPDLVNKIDKDSGGNVIGFNFVANTYDPAHPNNYTDPTDDHGHGTHCSGIAAAQTNNGTGMSGIAGWNGVANQTDFTSTKIMPLKVLAANGSGYDSDVATAIVWAADHGARVISMSLGGADASTTLNNAVTYAINHNVVVTAAAGNSGSSAYSYPGACPGVLSVASSEKDDSLSDFSNYGSWVTVAAPGRDIISTYINNDYAYLSGTSMATPHVAGVLALLVSQNPTLSVSQLFALVQNNTDPVNYPATDTRRIISGRLNAYKALLAATSLAAPTNLTATANSRSLITLTWQDNTTTEDGFSVEMSTNGTTFTSIGTVGLNKTSTTVSGLTRSTTYTFRIRAFAGAINSPYSATASAKTKAL